MKLGCLPRPAGVKAPLLMAKYLKALPPAPEKVYREYKIPDDAWQMFGNDTLGDCTCAAIAHMLMLVTAHTGTLVVPELSDVIAFYSMVSGYDPSQVQPDGSNPTDVGSDLPTVLNAWRDTGLSGHKIIQWTDIDPANLDNQKYGIYIFGATDDAVQLPNSAMDQFSAGQPWDVLPDDGGIDGGHSIPRFGYGSDGFACITWAKDQKGGTAWWQKYLQESCVVITQDWLDADGLTPSGFAMDALLADLAALKS
jgi:hypothetical protein